ncbi:hypothetical protein [uncultured Sphaerotilus sp.]|uniref:hypothetical protein n=1 Tax=uncultured Sphaerotilus sp. TaxID=474984 RepID=UPI0030CA26BA
MLTVHATLQPNGLVQLPPSLAKGRPVHVLVTILEPEPDVAQSLPDAEAMEPVVAGKGSVAATLALLRSPEFRAISKADPQEVEARIQALRNDWDDA